MVGIFKHRLMDIDKILKRNKEIVDEAIKMHKRGELKTTLEIHNWTRRHLDYTVVSQDHEIRQLHIAEQATENEKRKM